MAEEAGEGRDGLDSKWEGAFKALCWEQGWIKEGEKVNDAFKEVGVGLKVKAEVSLLFSYL